MTTKRKLTKAQRVALEVYNREGELNEGWLEEEWPAIRNARLVANGMERRGLVTFGEYTGRFDDGGAGYELILTDAGRRAAEGMVGCPCVGTPDQEDCPHA